eukprot:CAMPEP_0171337476 /NCGR_PEP_ID=MMETSP0878-20121228/6704_1 /TAXON_ID=67004 /ORGANISM="Thalassiosira weissflogii, Strain CCMP1336" /LENGTH=422 /DNA_ID=CAMNT_0011839099 /DNA_START=149 /DNA_END=1417 /DNA_ORIENTATION=+
MADDPEIVLISCLSKDEEAENSVAGLDSSSDNSSNPEKPASVKSEKPVAVKGRKPDVDGDVEVVDKSLMQQYIHPSNITNSRSASNPPSSADCTGKPKEDDDDGAAEEELEVVREANVTRLPHNRRDCLEFRFVPGGDASRNCGFCSLCYCYVCDVLAGECESWANGKKGRAAGNENDNVYEEGGENRNSEEQLHDGESSSEGATLTSAAASAVAASATSATAVIAAAALCNNSPNELNGNDPCKNHCMATDRGPSKHIWKLLRQAKKNGGDISSLTSARKSQATTASTGTMDSLRTFQENYGIDLAADDAMHFAVVRGGRGRGIGRGAAVLRTTYRRHSSAVLDYMHEFDMPMNTFAAHTDFRSRNQNAGRGRSDSASSATRTRRRRRDADADAPPTPSPRRRHDHQQRLRTQAMLEELYK